MWCKVAVNFSRSRGGISIKGFWGFYCYIFLIWIKYSISKLSFALVCLSFLYRDGLGSVFACFASNSAMEELVTEWAEHWVCQSWDPTLAEEGGGKQQGKQFLPSFSCIGALNFLSHAPCSLQGTGSSHADEKYTFPLFLREDLFPQLSGYWVSK